MRILAIGDIHGCSTAFDALINVFNPQLEDKIVTLGDYINKGPDAKGILTRLVALQQTNQLIALRGNHELKMLAAISGQDLGPESAPCLITTHWRHTEKGNDWVNYQISQIPTGILSEMIVWIGGKQNTTFLFTRLQIQISQLPSNLSASCFGKGLITLLPTILEKQ